MLNIKSNRIILVVVAFGGLMAALMVYGCNSGQNPPATTQSVAPATEPTFALFGPAPEKSGVQLWTENCARCHNYRPTEEFSSAQWEAIVHHMQLRANLTGKEAREIAKFLQASH